MATEGSRRPVRVCLLGGGGFLGSHLAERLLTESWCRVEVIDTSVSKLEHLPQRNLRVTRVSIATPGVIASAVERSDVMVSLTALCNPSLYNTEPLAVIAANYGDLVPLVELCCRQGKRLVHFSTCEVYGYGTPRIPNGQGPHSLVEDETPLTLGPVDRERWTYACAKQLLERTIWAYGQHHGLRFSIVRPFKRDRTTDGLSVRIRW